MDMIWMRGMDSNHRSLAYETSGDDQTPLPRNNLFLLQQENIIWCSRSESNRLSPGYKSGASPAMLQERKFTYL